MSQLWIADNERVITADGKQTICSCAIGYARSIEDNQALARRISALPDLEAACRALLAEFEKFSRYGSPIARDANEAVRFARAAIAKGMGS